MNDDTVTAGQAAEAWATARVTELLRGQPDGITVPDYGTAAWLRLGREDPRRAAAVITAAEAWRRHTEAQAALMSGDTAAFWDAMGDAPAEAQRAARRPGGDGRPLSARLDAIRAAQAARAAAALRAPRPVVATPGWPVQIPGRPGWWRHCINGAQVDLPGREINQERSAA
ncbi:hypothetical protein [Streptomyces sp. YIM 98790]|uniref:hypothetical protein n=1 Tax=Streptomyces sp. YIM 98790 TaxID=2689077 RepID=UPI00140C7B02|nr:hypothetical protein [Streptomyces sp. YIM 98790]